jgi:hypothetical protein
LLLLISSRAFDNGTLLPTEFAILKFKIYGKSIGSDEQAEYFPAEVGVARFSLQNGINSMKQYTELFAPPADQSEYG